jgi:hypothetical protein
VDKNELPQGKVTIVSYGHGDESSGSVKQSADRPCNAPAHSVLLYLITGNKPEGGSLSQLINYVSPYILLSYFPYFEKEEVGLCDLDAVYVSVNPPY